MAKTVHYCNRIIDPLTCCDLGGHSPFPLDEGFDDPRCTCPPMYKIRYCEEEGIAIPDNTCGGCWRNASSCGCPEPRVVLNPSEGVSYSYKFAAYPVGQNIKFRSVPAKDSVI